MIDLPESPCFILHRRLYRETSYLVDGFSANWGKISFVAKGARQVKSPNKSLLQPLQLLNVSLSGKHELKNLRLAESLEKSINLTGKSLFSALYLNELLNRLLPKELPFSDLFLHYQQCLSHLKEADNLEPGLREFEMLLLEELGYGVDFTSDWQTQTPLVAEHQYTFLPEQGFQLIPQGYFRGQAFTGAEIIDMGLKHWHPDSLRAAKRLNRIALAPLLGNKPLKSKELFRRQSPGV